MKNKLQQFIVKLLAATLAIIMAVPTNVFAMSQRKSNTYTAATSVMGIQPKDDAPETETSQETNLLKSAVSTEETTDYIIEKSANLSQTTGQVTYKIAVKTKDPSQEFTEDQTTTFGITENTDLKDLKVEKVQALDADGKEIDVKNTLNTPKAFNSTDNIRTLGITATKPQYGMVYYLSAQLTEEALKNLEEKSPQLALDITIASPNQDIFQTRYSLETTKIDTTEITIDNDGNVVNQTSDLVEKEDNLHLYKGEYKNEEKTLFQTTPAHLVWTDYINAKDDKEFTINFDLDENQNTENSQINIDYYEARDKGYVLNQSFSKTVDFTNSLNLTIPQGYIAKVSLSTAIKENTNAKEYTFNGVKVANPTYKEEKNQMTEEEQATDDADPLPDDSSKNDEETKPSNDSIADENKQDFSQNPKSDTSAIALNKEAYLEKLKDEEKLTENLEKAASDIELALESYNKEETNWDEFKATLQTIAKEQNLDQAQTEETLQALLAGLNEDKYKVANIDTKEATNLVEESTDQSEPKDATEKSVDELVKEKLNEEGITIEDFQNYMYELEEKYGLTDEDAARIYGDNAEAIQALAEKAQDEKTTGDVFVVMDQSKYRRTYPYDISYWTYQYFQNGKINWDIKINTSEVKLEYLDYNTLALALYAPKNQGLKDFKVTIKDYKGTEFSNNKRGVTSNGKSSGSDILSSGLTQTENMFIFDKIFKKSELPDQMYIHVEATPEENTPIYQMYDLGIRLTPDVNYISDIIEDFKTDFSKLLSMMPWILPFKSGDEALEKFKDGFNVIDTRLPADAKASSSMDSYYDGISYNDKSRSVYGQIIGDNSINWQISETVRLQDDERFISKSTSKLGNDIFEKKFNSNNAKGHTNPNIEVLEPNKDGTYTKIFSTYRPNNPSSAKDFRYQLSQVRDVLLPGTIINYSFERTAEDIHNNSILSIDFNSRYDDGVGIYGGQSTSSVKKETTINNDSLSDPNAIISNADGRGKTVNPDGKSYNVAYATLDKNLPNSSYESYKGYAAAQVITQNGLFVYCLNHGLTDPGDFYSDIKLGRYLDPKADKIKDSVNKKGANYLTSSTAEKLEDDLKKVFYYVNEYDGFNSETDKWFTTQTLIYRAIDGNLEKKYGNGSDLGSSERNYLTDNYIYNTDSGTFGRNPDLTYRVQQAIDIQDNMINGTVSQKEINQAVVLDLYKISGNNTRRPDTTFQEVIGGYVINPIEVNKVNNNTKEKIDGAEFDIINLDTNQIIKIAPSKTNNARVYLKEGKYKLVETRVPTGYKKLEDTTFIVQYQSQPKQYETSYRKGNPGQLYPNKGPTVSSTDFLEKDRYKISEASGSNLAEVSNDGLLLTAGNEPTEVKPEEFGFKINKKLFGSDDNYHNFPYVKFILTEQGGSQRKFENRTNSYGEIEFTGLSKNSTWILEEEIPTGVQEPSKKSWTVKVNDNGNITIDNQAIINNTFEVLNKPDIKEEFGKFKIKKVDQDGRDPIPQAGFTLYKNKDDESSIIGEETFTNDDGEIYYYNIPYGTYWLKETTVPKGYQTPSEDKIWTKVTVDRDTQGSGGEVVNPGDSTNPDQTVLKSRIATNNTSGTISSNGNHLADITSKLNPISSENIVRDYDLEINLTADELYDTVTSESKSYDTLDVVFLVENDNNIDSFNDYNTNVGKVLTNLKGRENTARIGVISYNQGGINRQLELTPVNNVNENQLKVSKGSTGGRKTLINTAMSEAKTMMQNSNAKRKMVIIVSSGKNVVFNTAASNTNLKSAAEVYAYVKNENAYDTAYYAERDASGVRITTDINYLVKGTTGWFDKVENSIDKYVSTTTTPKKVPKPAINGQTLTLTPGQGFEITGNNKFSLPKLAKGQTHTINTTVRFTDSTPGTYNVLDNIFITNGSVNINSPSVEIYEGRVAAAGSLFKNLFTSTAYAAGDTNSTNEDYSKVKITNDKSSLPDGLSFDNVVPYTIVNKKKTTGEFKILKVDSENQPLEGVKFKLTGPGNVKDIKPSGENGVIEFTNLTPGDYTLVESETKSGYIKTNQTWKVVVADNGSTTISSAGVSLTNALNSIDISESYASELPATNKVNFVFIVENIKGKSENTIKQFNDSIETIRKDLANKYGSNATITLVSNGHQVMQGFKNGQPVIYANRPVTSNEEFKLVNLDQNGGDSHLDEAIKNARGAIKDNKADNYVFIMQSGNAEGYRYAFNNNNGLFRPEDNVIRSVMMFENASKDTIDAYTSGDRLGGLVSDKNAILTIDNQSIESIIKSQLSSTGVFESTNNNSSEDKDYIVPDAQEKALNNLDELKSKGFIITNSSDYKDSNISIIKVINKKPTYPSTGGSGTFIGFALIGTAIMLAGIAYYGIYVNDKNRRRSNRYGK